MNTLLDRPIMLLVVLCALTVALPAQSQTYRIVRPSGGGLQLVAPDGQISPVPVHPQNGVILVFNCDPGANPPIDCTTLTASLVDLTAGTTETFTPTSPTAAGAQITIPAGKTGDLTVRIGSNAATPPIPLVSSTAGDGPAGVEVVQRPEVACAAVAGLGGAYDQERNEAQFVVATDGFVIARPPQPIDENDIVRVHVVGDPDVLRTVKIERTSTIRGVGQVRFVGEDVIGTIRRHAFSAECGVASSPVTDFAPGEGVVTVTTLNPQRQPVTGRVSFRVNPLYRGAFSFGPVLSRLEDRTYGTLADSTITETKVGSPRGEYLLSYTHFVWGQRDVEKSILGLQNLNPMIGISLEKPLESVFLGGAFDLLNGDVFVVAGAHGAEVTRLDPRSGLAVGQRLPAGFGSVPTREEWEWEWFYGVTVDLRAAVKLFGTVLTGGQR